MSELVNGAEGFTIRTEDLLPEDFMRLYVPTARDEELVALLASHTPLIIEGSRGTGKSMLLRVCEQKQLQRYQEDRVLPVYVTFVKSSLLDTSGRQQFLHWMLARLASQVVRAIQKRGLALGRSRAVSILTGGSGPTEDTVATRLEQVAEAFERSYRSPKSEVDETTVPTVEEFRDAIEDLCEELGIRRINVLFDEAAHIFRPEQQRQFFTLFRDLRSPRMTCNAAVYPGVTAYGDVFEGTHDARIEQLARGLDSAEYLRQMREIVLRQSSGDLAARIEANGGNFDAMAYAVSGNPRILLKIVSEAGRMSTGAVNAVLKEFFRGEVWSEHSGLATRYPGHRFLVDWGRRFVEGVAIPEARKKNDGWRERGTNERSKIIWVSRDAPAAAQEALRLLTYTGILIRMADGIKGTGSQIGTRYSINVGCLVAGERSPIDAINELRQMHTIKRFTEFGPANPHFQEVSEEVGTYVESDMSLALSVILAQSVDQLDLTAYQIGRLRSLGIDTIGKALASTESELQAARGIGPVKSRRMMNAATAATLEYLSG